MTSFRHYLDVFLLVETSDANASLSTVGSSCAYRLHRYAQSLSRSSNCTHSNRSSIYNRIYGYRFGTVK
jgi:hypothetical protein